MLAIADRIGARWVFAAGNGALDAGFLAAADAGMRPPHGELAELGWKHPSVVIGDRPGVLAADDITSWFAERSKSTAGDHSAVSPTGRASV